MLPNLKNTIGNWSLRFISLLSIMIVKPVLVFLCCLFVSSALFGLLLTLAWNLPFSGIIAVKSATAVVTAGIAVAAGGFTSSCIYTGYPEKSGGIFGLLFGLISAIYLLGPTLFAAVFTGFFTLSGYMGGLLHHRFQRITYFL